MVISRCLLPINIKILMLGAVCLRLAHQDFRISVVYKTLVPNKATIASAIIPKGSNASHIRGTVSDIRVNASSPGSKNTTNDLDSKRSPSHPPSSDSSNEVLPHTDSSEVPQDQGTSSTCRIPKLVHFIYLSPHLPLEQQPVPDKVLRTVERWIEVNQGWEVRLWNNAMVREHFPDLVNLMSNVTTMAWVADMARYHIVQQFGGMYVDTDFVPFQSMDALCQVGNFIVCELPHQRPELSPDTGLVMDRKSCSVAINAVMGFEPNHPAVNKMLNVSLTNTRNALARNSNAKFRLRYTGPRVWTGATKQDTSVSVLRPYTFLPCHWKGKQYCNESKFGNDPRVYAMHKWDKSWG